MAVNKPVGDNARKGAVKKRSQVKTRLGGATAWTKRSRRAGGEEGGEKEGARRRPAVTTKNSQEIGTGLPTRSRLQTLGSLQKDL